MAREIENEAKVLQATCRGLLVRRKLVHRLRQEYVDICKSLESDFRTELVTWKKQNTLCIPTWSHFEKSKAVYGTTNVHPPHVFKSENLAEPINEKQTNILVQHSVSLDGIEQHDEDDSLGSVSDLMLSGQSSATLTLNPEDDNPPDMNGLYTPTAGEPSRNDDCKHQEREHLHDPASPSVTRVQSGSSIDTEEEARRHLSAPVTGRDVRIMSNLQLQTLPSHTPLLETDSSSKSVLHDAQSHHTDAVHVRTSLYSAETMTDSTNRESSQPHRKQLCSDSGSSEEHISNGVDPSCAAYVGREESHLTEQSSLLTSDQVFYKEICGIIAQAEAEGKSYEELRAQMVLELSWIQQAIRSRQQYLQLRSTLQEHTL